MDIPRMCPAAVTMVITAPLWGRPYDRHRFVDEKTEAQKGLSSVAPLLSLSLSLSLCAAGLMGAQRAGPMPVIMPRERHELEIHPWFWETLPPRTSSRILLSGQTTNAVCETQAGAVALTFPHAFILGGPGMWRKGSPLTANVQKRRTRPESSAGVSTPS